MSPKPIITVKEAKKLLGVNAKNIADTEIEQFVILLAEIAATYIQEKSFQN